MSRHAVPLLLVAVLLGGCAGAGESGLGEGPDAAPAVDANDGGGTTQPFPANYRSEIPAFLRTYLNNPVGLRDAGLTEPVRRPIGRNLRYMSCVRFTPQGGAPQELGIVYLNGRLDRTAPNAREICTGAVYAPFPELQKLSR